MTAAQSATRCACGSIATRHDARDHQCERCFLLDSREHQQQQRREAIRRFAAGATEGAPICAADLMSRFRLDLDGAGTVLRQLRREGVLQRVDTDTYVARRSA